MATISTAMALVPHRFAAFLLAACLAAWPAAAQEVAKAREQGQACLS